MCFLKSKGLRDQDAKNEHSTKQSTPPPKKKNPRIKIEQSLKEIITKNNTVETPR